MYTQTKTQTQTRQEPKEGCESIVRKNSLYFNKYIYNDEWLEIKARSISEENRINKTKLN